MNDSSDSSANGQRSGDAVANDNGEHWQDPRELPDGPPALPDVTLDMLPVTLRAFASSLAGRIRVPLGFAALPVMVALASVASGAVRVMPKQHDSWALPLTLWLALCGPPSSRKSTVIKPALGFLEDLQAEERTHWEAAGREALRGYERTLESLERRHAKAIEVGDDEGAREAQIRLRDHLAKPRPPALRRFQTSTATPEGIVRVLADSPRGILLERDELAGWLAEMEQSGREKDRPFWLQAWNGSQYTSDTVTRGATSARLIVGILGGTQPSVLARLTSEARKTSGGDGLASRLHVFHAERATGADVDLPEDVAARDEVLAVFKRLAKTLFAESNCEASLRFTPEATARFMTWSEEVRGRGDVAGGALAAYLAKLPGEAAKLAGVITLCEASSAVPPSAIAVAAVDRGIALADVLATHAHHSYAVSDDMEAARGLLRRLLEGRLRSGFTRRDVQRPGWSLLDEAGAESALAVLVEHGWLREKVRGPSRNGGRGTVEYVMHPCLVSGWAA